MRDGDFHQGRKVHEDPEGDPGGIARQAVATGQRLDPFGPDDAANDADNEHPDDQEGKDLLYSARIPKASREVLRASRRASTATARRPSATPTNRPPSPIRRT